MLKSIGSNLGRIAVGIVVLFVLTPVVYNALGIKGSDLWLLITSLLNILGLLLLGVPMTSVKFFAEHVAKRDTPGLNRAIAACFSMYLGLGIAACLIGAGLFGFYELKYQVDPEWVDQGRVAFGLMVIAIGSGFIGQLPYGIMAAHGDFTLSNSIVVLGMLLKLGLTVILMRIHATLPALAAITLAVTVFEFIACLVVIGKRYPGIRFSLTGADRATVRRILGFSLLVLLLNIGNKLAFNVDSLVIGAFFPDGGMTAYARGNDFMLYLLDFALGVGQVVLPLAARLKAQGDEEGMRQNFLQWSKIVLSLALLPSLYLFVLGPEFIGWWIGPELERPAGQVLQILTPSFLLFFPARGVAMPALIGRGRIRGAAWALFWMGVLNLGMSITLAPLMGLNGVALGTAIPNVLFALGIIHLMCKDAGIPIMRWTGYVLGRTLIGSLPVLALLLFFKLGLHVQGIVALALACAATTILFSLIWVFFVYAGDPYVDLRGRITALLKRRSAKA